VPRHAVTFGTSAILAAKRCLIIVTGQIKADSVMHDQRRAGDVLPRDRASDAPVTISILDKEAASNLRLRD
jgi:6-phosphogluconolactonase/glucosamine-6-phosphate isomerase/deaminase